MKVCSKCLISKQLNEFYQRKSGKRKNEYYEKCRECMKARGRKYYQDNKARQLPLAIRRTKKARKTKREFLMKIKDKPCIDCGTKYPPYVMDFDHRESSDKISAVALMVAKNWSLKRIKSEIEKCDLVCANCHRIRTFKLR